MKDKFLSPGYKLLNRYEIKHVLGAGSFGNVYLAHDLSLPREVAIKELKQEWLSDDLARMRFINDARAMAKLQSNNIVQVYDLLEPSKDSVENYYIVMQYMVGGTLDGLIRLRRMLPIRDSLEITIGVCKGLAKAHKEGIVHRDVKPDNILLGEMGEVKLSDFGIAHIPGLRLTLGGQPGTLFWLSVEQAVNLKQSIEEKNCLEQKAVDQRSDLYSVAAMLYQMLTGRYYLDFDDCVAKARQAAHQSAEEQVRRCIYQEVCDAIINHFPKKPSIYRPEITEQLNVKLLKGLAKKAEYRFQTAGEMVKELDAIAKSLTEGADEADLKRAAKLLDEGVSDEAGRIVKQFLTKHATNLTAIELMGDIHLQCRDYYLAVEMWEKARELKPDHHGICQKLGGLYNRLKNLDKAAQVFRRGLELRPDDPSLCNGLAMALWNGGQRREAIEALRTSCKLLHDPRKEALLTTWLKQVGDDGPAESVGEDTSHG